MVRARVFWDKRQVGKSIFRVSGNVLQVEVPMTLQACQSLGYDPSPKRNSQTDSQAAIEALYLMMKSFRRVDTRWIDWVYH